MSNIYAGPRLPKSLRKKRIRKIITRISLCILLLAGGLFLIIAYGDMILSIRDKEYAGIRILFYLIILVLPFIITGVPMKLIDTSFSGTVIATEVRERTDTVRVGVRYFPYKRQDMILTIKKDDGKEIRYTALSLGSRDSSSWTLRIPAVGKMEYHTQEYNVGDRIYKYYGFKHIFVQMANEGRTCIVCGSKNDSKDNVCWCCDSELIAG